MREASYEIRVIGTVPAELVVDLRATMVEESAQTVVRIGPSDQAALFGLLARLPALGLQLVEVRRLPAEPDSLLEG